MFVHKLMIYNKLELVQVTDCHRYQVSSQYVHKYEASLQMHIYVIGLNVLYVPRRIKYQELFLVSDFLENYYVHENLGKKYIMFKFFFFGFFGLDLELFFYLFHSTDTSFSIRIGVKKHISSHLLFHLNIILSFEKYFLEFITKEFGLTVY